MSGGWADPATGDFGVLKQELDELRRRVRELERPTGTQTAQTVRTIQEQQAELAATVELLSRFADDAERDTVSNFPLTTTSTVRGQEVFTAPDYPTRALFTVLGAASVLNNSGSVDLMESRVRVDFSTLPGPFISTRSLVTATSGAYADASPNFTFDLGNLPPNETVTMVLQLNSVANTWTADINNTAQLSYIVRLAPII